MLENSISAFIVSAVPSRIYDGVLVWDSIIDFLREIIIETFCMGDLLRGYAKLARVPLS